jgi:hypothetical protein
MTRLAAIAISAVLATTADAASKQRKPAQPARVVCGQTGCFDVPPGCGYEMRRTGRGSVVAVILCDRK